MERVTVPVAGVIVSEHDSEDLSEVTMVQEESQERVKRHEEKVPIPFWQREIFTVPVIDTWPAPVTCKMNIREWAELMREVGLTKS